MLSINFDCIHILPTGPLPSLFVEWLGHYWSFCYINLNFIIQRMIGVSNDRFRQEIVPLDAPLIKNPSYPPSPGLVSPALTPRQDKILEEADQIVVGENKDEEKRKHLITSDQTPLENDKIDQPSDTPKEEGEIKEKPTPIKTSPDKDQQEPSTPQLVQPYTPKAEDPVLDDNLLLEEIDIPHSGTKIEPEKLDDPQPLNITGERRRRPWRGQPRLNGRKPLIQVASSVKPEEVFHPLIHAKASPKPSPRAAVSRVLKPKRYPKHAHLSDFARLKKEYEIIDCGASGDCQLQCILEGLKRQHPKLANYEKDKQNLTYTALDLRQIGVAYAWELMDKDDLMTGCIDSDLLEYDDDIMQDEQKRKVSDVRIDTHDEFLRCLENPGFYCSKVHLYALSMKFKVPIHVHQISEKKDAKVQTIHFNPTHSKLEPIQLIHERTHYKLMQKRKS